MNLKRAIGLSVFAYIASFTAGTFVAFIYGIDLGETGEIPPLLWYSGAVVSVIFAGLFAKWYFRSPKTTANMQEGFKFGLIMVATGFVLDLITLLPLLAHENPFELMFPYYTSPYFWATIALVLAATTLTGKYLGSKDQEVV